MSGITYQFANSPINKRVKLLSVSASGTVSALGTGSSCLMWRAETHEDNLGNIRISTINGTTQYWFLNPGMDTGWVPGNLEGYWWYGTATGTVFSVWEME